MQIRLLEKTQNFLELYAHWCGRSEIPKEFHFWCGIAIIAAALQDHVWLEKFKGEKLTPALYTFLVGPSGAGKGGAMNRMMKLVQPSFSINAVRIKTTGQHLYDFLSSPRRSNNGKVALSSAKAFLVMPELAFCLGKGERADNFIKTMTDLWDSGDDPRVEGTRTSGQHVLENACLNWAAGTTLQWLKDCITPEMIASGFFARIATVYGKRDPKLRIPEPWFPPDYEEVNDHLHARVAEMTYRAGLFVKTNTAREVEHAWYMKRPEVDEEDLPYYQREHDLLLKLSMILSVAEGRPELILTEGHMTGARVLLARLRRMRAPIRAAAVQKQAAEEILSLVELIRKRKAIPRKDAIDYMLMKFGTPKERFDEMALTLIEGGKIHCKAVVGHPHYIWAGRKFSAKELFSE